MHDRPPQQTNIFPPVTDTETARSYDLDIAEWYVPVNVVTREVDYTDVTVQVRTSSVGLLFQL